MRSSDPFVRVPTALFDALIRTQLSGGQLLTLLWVIRQSYGWNRTWAEFSWYGIAKDLGLSRPAVYRAGQQLLRTGLLQKTANRLAVETDLSVWSTRARNSCRAESGQLPLPGMHIASKQRITLSCGN